MKKLVPGLLITLVCWGFSSFGADFTLDSALIASGVPGCRSSQYEKIDDQICQETGVAFCRDIAPSGDASCRNVAAKVNSLPLSCKFAVQGSGGLTYDAQLKACEQLSGQAELCCGTSLEGCMKQIPGLPGVPSGGSTDSISAVCKKMKDDTSVGAKVNAALAGTCIARKSFWKNECDEMVSKAKKQIETECAAAQGLSTACTDPILLKLSTLKCPASVDAATLKAQAEAMNQNSELAALCKGSVDVGEGGGPDGDDKVVDDDTDKNETKPASVDDGKKSAAGAAQMMSALGPMLQQLLAPKDEEAEAEEEKDDIDCAINPANCPVPETQAENTPMASGMMNSSDSTDPVFDPQDIPLDSPVSDIQPMAINPSGQGGTIPNGGGSMPAGLGGGDGGKMPGGGYRGAPHVNPKDYPTGFNAYGGSLGKMNESMKLEPGSPGGYRTSSASNEPDFDLKPFLPGHSKDPRRGLAGNMPRIAEIQGKNVDIWLRVSDRFKNHCNLGLLRDCTP